MGGFDFSSLLGGLFSGGSSSGASSGFGFGGGSGAPGLTGLIPSLGGGSGGVDGGGILQSLFPSSIQNPGQAAAASNNKLLTDMFGSAGAMQGYNLPASSQSFDPVKLMALGQMANAMGGGQQQQLHAPQVVGAGRGGNISYMPQSAIQRQGGSSAVQGLLQLMAQERRSNPLSLMGY